MSKRMWLFLIIITLAVIFVACSSDDNDQKAEIANVNDDDSDGDGSELEHDPPSIDDLDPDHPKSEYIEDGEEIFNETDSALDESGNELSCASCHADGGTGQESSLVGVTTQFPQYRPREGTIFTIEDRINGCMVRSMNGEKLEEDSDEMRSMVAYLNYISAGIKQGEEDIPWRMQNTMEDIPEPDVDSGDELYEENCASCHGDDGSGTGANSGPAVWGEDSFNDGAGMGRMQKMAGFIQNNMPPNSDDELSDQDSADLAAYLLSQERPEWKGHDDDWTRKEDDRPTDIIDKDRREAIQNGTFDWEEIENIVPGD